MELGIAAIRNHKRELLWLSRRWRIIAKAAMVVHLRSPISLSRFEVIAHYQAKIYRSCQPDLYFHSNNLPQKLNIPFVLIHRTNRYKLSVSMLAVTVVPLLVVAPVQAYWDEVSFGTSDNGSSASHVKRVSVFCMPVREVFAWYHWCIW